jgi:catechol 2,3-dioxygenase-like lactoylglutathione lyase family enzyme
MNYRLEHIAVLCENLEDSIEFYRKLFGGTPTEMRKSTAGYRFCFVKIDGELAIQLMESKGQTGVHHYGFAADDVDQVARDLKEKGVEFIRENRGKDGKLTNVFFKDPNGLEVEIRTPR